ncbi:Invasion protein IalB, involved in pathogenesis [Salinihabitans flavidus]|uniref:Invasion protein IalB, involved in pathogenesis n=1 Tax=Salinihabitans flavidus TaxID=569882 RepID=A0A1H8VA50_9RHOB|nr:invasion associated locus B family protein [Salinihabitans flavidus]SEP11688.1 Invasion protein IalB, involved in pathogenesis [Salinihabitans flavidus]
MSSIFKFLPALALVALGGGAIAQDVETDSDLSMGEAIAEDDAENISREAIGDWELQCQMIDGEKGPCSMHQLLLDENENPVAEVNIFRLANGGMAAAGATIIVPLETLLTAQLTIAIDGGAAKRYPFAYCTQVGCVARIGFTEQDLEAYKKGQVALATIVPAVAPDQTVDLDISLSGFTKAYEESTPVEQPAPTPTQN